jgi:hypothetical protein
MSFTPRLADETDIPAILALQAKNLVSNLSLEEQKNGFVTTPLSTQHLETLIAGEYAFVAAADTGIAAYMITGSWAFFDEWPVFRHMVAMMPELLCQGIALTAQNSFQYGPVCIAEEARGSGLLLDMFTAMRLHLATRYPLGVTFVNKRNHRSFAAHHRKLGIEVIAEFAFGGQEFHYMAFPLTLSPQK